MQTGLFFVSNLVLLTIIPIPALPIVGLLLFSSFFLLHPSPNSLMIDASFNYGMPLFIACHLIPFLYFLPMFSHVYISDLGVFFLFLLFYFPSFPDHGYVGLPCACGWQSNFFSPQLHITIVRYLVQ